MQKELLDIQRQQAQQVKPVNCMNINVGVLGHVDSGKTSICKILSQVYSTASMDKSPQSQQRGITLDLGFSSFLTRVPSRFNIPNQYLQFTLVDCPGHASLIRTIIGGAQIIDLMFMVVDVNKGIQTQTAECIIIAELFIKKLIIVLNKVDSLEDKASLEARIAALKKILSKTKFAQQLIIVPFSTKENPNMYCRKLKSLLLDQLELPHRNIQGKFIMLVDHCFKIKGKGTIMTGTVINGRVKSGEEVQICELQQKTKIKSMQMFRKSLQTAKQGDRVAMLVTQVEANLIERGVVCTPGYLKKTHTLIMNVQVILPYIRKRVIKNKAKFHMISGHQTVMGEVRLFISKQQELHADSEYISLALLDEATYKNNIENENKQYFFAIVTFQKTIYTIQGNQIIGYKYDIDDEKACRIAFHGKIHSILNEQKKIKMYKQKQKYGIVERQADKYTVIVKEMFTKENKIQQYIGRQVFLQSQEPIKGKIEGTFGNSGKIRVSFAKILNIPQIQGLKIIFKFKKWYQ